MGLVFELIRQGYKLLTYRGPLPSAALDGERPIDEGPDDLWPAEDDDPVLGDTEPPRIALSEPELVVNRQWGLKLPNGDVHWVHWNGHAMGHPLDRVRLIAKLQKTAEDIGLAPGWQTDDFLSHYGWVTRDQIASVVYKDTGAYPLTHSQVSALDTPSTGETHESDDASSESSGRHHDRGVRTGSVGGDA